MTETATIPDTSSAQRQTARPRTSFAGDVLKLVLGTAFAQLLGILASPILTRLYTPEAFGVFAIFTSITAIISVITCLRYELAIMLPESDEEAANLLGVSLMFAVMVSLLTVPIVWWGRGILLGWINTSSLAPYLWLVPVAVLFSGIFTALNYWNSRTKQFGRLSIARVTTSLATTTGQLGAGFAGFATGGTMIGASVGGSMLATTVLGGQIWRDDRKIFLGAIRWSDMFTGVKRYRKFPLYDTWSSLLNTISWQLPALLMASFFSPAIVGYYALGFRILQMPMSLIGAAISQVFFQRAADAKMHKNLGVVVENTFGYLVVIGLYPILTLTLISRDLFAVVFGPNWTEAGVYAQLLSIWVFFWFVSSPLSTVFSILEKQEFLLKFNLVNFLTRFASLYIGGAVYDARMSILLFSSSGIIVYGYLVMSVMSQSGVSLRRMLQILGKSMLSFAPACAILVYLLVVGAKIELRLVVAGLLLAGYYLLLIMRHPTYLNQLKEYLGRS